MMKNNEQDELQPPATYAAVRVVLDPMLIQEEGALLKAMAKAQKTSVSTFTRRLYRLAMLEWEDCPEELKPYLKTAFGDLGKQAQPKKKSRSIWAKKPTRKEKS